MHLDSCREDSRSISHWDQFLLFNIGNLGSVAASLTAMSGMFSVCQVTSLPVHESFSHGELTVVSCNSGAQQGRVPGVLQVGSLKRAVV